MTPDAQLAGFIDKYTPDIAAEARTALAHLAARIPGANQLAYDNYNALAVGFAANDKVGGVVLSLAVYPRWLTLFLMRGAELPDPGRLLSGTGALIRSLRLTGAARLADPDIEALIAAALVLANPPIDPQAPGRLIIKSISPKQRPRRP